jgi:hypothetical protein
MSEIRYQQVCTAEDGCQIYRIVPSVPAPPIPSIPIPSPIPTVIASSVPVSETDQPEIIDNGPTITFMSTRERGRGRR